MVIWNNDDHTIALGLDHGMTLFHTVSKCPNCNKSFFRKLLEASLRCVLGAGGFRNQSEKEMVSMKS